MRYGSGTLYLRAGGSQKWSDILFHDDFANKGRRREPPNVERHGIANIHAKRRCVHNDVPSLGVVAAGKNLQGGVVHSQSVSECVHRRFAGIVERHVGNTRLGQRSGNRRPYPAATDHHGARACQWATFS